MGYKLYVSKDCPHCESARECLRKRGIKFKEVSCDTGKGNKEADRIGIKDLPTLVRNGKILSVEGCV